MSDIAQLINVSKTYHTDSIFVPALQGLNLNIETGEFVTLAGPSGSGKTTFLNLLGGLDKPTGGEVFIKGKNLGKLRKNELAEYRLRKVGFVFQAYNLINSLTALENVEYIMHLQGIKRSVRRSRATELLVKVGLEDYLNTRPMQMSGGQQQRVAVARAIVTKPEMVLADEPTANLDSKTGSELIKLFKELCESYKTTFIIASHDPIVREQTKRLIILKDGEIVGDH